MDDTTKWLFAGVFGSIAGILGLHLAHILTCRKSSAEQAAVLATIDERTKHMGSDLGLLRDWTAAHGDLATRIGAAEKNLEGLRDWKHEKIDPYMPGEMNALNARVTRLEREA